MHIGMEMAKETMETLISIQDKSLVYSRAFKDRNAKPTIKDSLEAYVYPELLLGVSKTELKKLNINHHRQLDKSKQFKLFNVIFFSAQMWKCFNFLTSLYNINGNLTSEWKKLFFSLQIY